MKNKPNKIYLQIGLEEYGETCDDFDELNDGVITWCTDKINNDDLEYISVDVIRELDDELAMLEDGAKGSLGDVITKMRGKIDKLLFDKV